ncbi:TPA: hypothetical protein ACHHY3_001460 [Legionella pneumophila]|nr:hypothetical protein [Legionella pneumophila]HAU0785978.1 hypothetical protein [Legionella pneumophila]HAU0809834.1 hypothetical protein [Legionella pneumophila]HAU0905289.1 hypothetical protein [Legionella pneumophila]HAU1627912.1 hypothetical protein [Legionella pneumophila]
MAKFKLHPPTGRRDTLRGDPVETTVLLDKEINTPKGESPIIKSTITTRYHYYYVNCQNGWIIS